MQERINAYWSKRADEFGDARYTDMQGQKRKDWSTLIGKVLPEKHPIRSLDLGTGAGFFSFILSDLGCEVIGVDYSEEMLKNARKNAEKLSYPAIQFRKMDAQDLQFADNSFDFIFTRNVTWTLPDPAKAYSEMVRVLAPGGRLMNADANYAQAFKKFDESGATEKMAVNTYGGYENPARSLSMLRERNDIAKSLYIAEESRPLWDIRLLMELGIEKISFDLDVNVNHFGYQRSTARENISPEFIVIAEK